MKAILVSAATESAVLVVYPPQCPIYHRVGVHLSISHLSITMGTQRDLINLLCSTPGFPGIVVLIIIVVRFTFVKEHLLHCCTAHHHTIPAYQTPVAGLVPEAPAQADTAVAPHDNFAAHPTYGEVQESFVTRLAC
jgi:hypothetical protein